MEYCPYWSLIYGHPEDNRSVCEDCGICDFGEDEYHTYDDEPNEEEE